MCQDDDTRNSDYWVTSTYLQMLRDQGPYLSSSFFFYVTYYEKTFKV